MAASAYRVKKLMDLTGWSQPLLAQKIGVSQQTVQQWVDGKSIPSPANLDKLTGLTGYPSYWFILPPEETDQFSISDTMKIGPSQRALLRVFNAFPKEEQEKILKEMTEKKESMEELVARWIKAQKNNLS
ncbi:helix-turn-helix domain-containing protein [Salmonella enterica]|nr:helix-turn-helix domain-containing protein [Salmonella enterica]